MQHISLRSNHVREYIRIYGELNVLKKPQNKFVMGPTLEHCVINLCALDCGGDNIH